MPRAVGKRSLTSGGTGSTGKKARRSPSVGSEVEGPFNEDGIMADPMIDIQPSDDEMSASDADLSQATDDASIVSEDNAVDGDEDDLEAQPTAGPSKPKHRDLYAPPTLEELDTLSSSSSTSFNLQLSALLSSTLLPQKPHSSLKSLLTELHSLINDIPDSPPVSPKEGLRKVGLPPISPEEFYPTKANWTVGYRKPGEVFVSGSWSVTGGYKRGKGEQGGVDLVLVMPEVSCREH